ncbi:hypothetical protein N7G274_005895 [Stereocaulon virgatum]|uniref:Uncharacterized protein n=1 Tax=Stereocaulon virgatum TaxID=373712 RepID=A0ABR4ADN9_9LECA
MQKWHVHSAIGRGRPLSSSLHNQCALTLPRHHFHTSSPHRNGRDKVMEEATMSSPNRAKRLEDASLEMQNLYLRHAGKDKSPPGHRNAFKMPLMIAPEDQPVVLDARHMGVLFGKEVLEGKSFVPRVDQGPRFRKVRQAFVRDGGAGAVDARASGTKPEGALERERFTIKRSGTVDTSTLAEPERALGRERLTMERSGTVDASALSAKPEGDLKNRRFPMGGSSTMDASALSAKPERALGRERLTMKRSGTVDASALSAKPESAKPERALGRERLTMKRSGTVDASALSAKPEGDLKNRRFTMGRSSTVDASALSAKPEQALGRERLTMKRSDTVDASALSAKPKGNLKNQRFTMGRSSTVDASALSAKPERALGRERLTMERSGTVDASALSAKPERALGRERLTMERSGTVDASALSAKPEGDLKNRRFTMGRSGAIDARNLAAEPPQTVGLPERQRLPRRPIGDREQSMGLEGERRSPLRVPRSGQEQDTEPRDRQSRGEDSGFEDRRPRGGYGLRTRNDNNGIQEHAPQRGTDFQARPTRGGFRGAPRRGGSAYPRPARDDGGGEPSKRRRGGGERRRGRNFSGDSSDVGYVNIWNEEEAAYMKQKNEEKAVRSAAFNPQDVPEQGLAEYIPAIMSGEKGISQILEERLALAKKHLEGKFIQWDSKEQQADVMTLVEALKAEMAGKHGEGKEQKEKEISKTKQEADALLEKLWMGKYELARPKTAEDVLGHVARQTDRNETYFAKDEKSLLETLQSILPANAGRREGQATKQARK